MRTSTQGLNLIKEFEGCELKAYRCPAGVWTIGYGHTGDVSKGDKITKKQADDFLKEDIKKFENGLNKYVTAPLNQNQYDALISLIYNIGIAAFQTSTLRRKLNAEDYKGAAKEFPRWNKADGQVLKGLIRRREAEKLLFEKIPVKTVYTVKKGDCLSEIAAKFDTTVQNLVKLNNIKDADKINVGQKIKLN